MPDATIIDDATAADYMDTFDAVPPDEQAKRLSQLQAYVQASDQLQKEAEVKRSYSNFDDLGGTWNDQGRSWEPDQKADVANMRFIAQVSGKNLDEITHTFPALQSQYALQQFGDATLKGKAFYDKVAGLYKQQDEREAALSELRDSTIINAVEGKPTNPVQNFQQWKAKYADAFPNMDEAGMLDTYTKATKAFSEQQGPLASLAGEIISAIPKAFTPTGPTVDMQGNEIPAPTDNLNPGNKSFGTSFAFESSEALRPAVEKLAALSEEDRKKTLALMVQYAQAKGIDPKPVSQAMVEAFGRTVGDITEGFSNMDAASYLTEKEKALNGIVSAGGVDQKDFQGKQLMEPPAGYFNPDDLTGSLASVRTVDPKNPPAGAPPLLTQEQISALHNEVERQRKISRITRDLRMIAKGEIDPTISANKGAQGFFENAGIGLAEIAPYAAVGAIPTAGIPLTTAAITASEYDRISTEHPDLAEENVAKLATYSGIAQGFSMAIGVRALEGLPITGGLLKSLARPSEESLGTIGKIVGQSALSAAELGVQGEIMAGTLGLTDGIATALEKDKPGVDWHKALSVFDDAQVGTFQSLAPLWLVGLGAISVRNVAGGMKLASDVNALESIFGDREVARRIAKAPEDKKDALIQEAFAEMSPSQKEDLVNMVDSHVADVEAAQNSKNAPTLETKATVVRDGAITRTLVVKDSKGNTVFESPSLEAATQAWREQRNHEYEQDLATATEGGETAKPGEAAKTAQAEKMAGSMGPGAGAADEHTNRRIVYGADVISEMEKSGDPKATVAQQRKTWDEAMRKEYDGIEDSELDSLWAKSQDAYLEHQITAGTKPLPEIVRQKTSGEKFDVTKSPTSLKNETVDQQRREKNLPPAMQQAKRAFKGVWDEAMRYMDENPQYQSELIARLKSDPSEVLRDIDSAILLHHQITLHNDYARAVDAVNKAHDSGDAVAIKAANEQASRLLDEVQETYDIGKAAGTAAGRALSIRRMLANEDYSLARLTAKKMAAKGGKLTAEEAALLKKQHDDIQAKQEKLDALEATRAELETEKARTAALEDALAKMREEKARSAKREAKGERMAKTREAVVKIGNKTREMLAKQAEAARARIRERGFSFSAGVDPTVLLDVATIGAHHIAEGAAKFAEWSERMIKDFGEKIKPHLQEIFDKSKELATDTDKIGRMMENLSERVKSGDEDFDLSRYANTLARDAIERGITSRDAVVANVHEALKQALPDITPREVADAISGYGKFKELKKDTVSVQLRTIKGELQQIAKIQDMEARKAPKKTGMEHRETGDEERRLVQKVNELKKKGGYDTGDPAKTLRSALDAIKTRLKNQIKELAYRIDTGRKPDPRNPSPTDSEVELLRAQRDRIKKTVEAIEGKPETTDAQRIAIAMKAVDRSIEEISRRIKEGDFVKEKRVPLSSPELDAAKARRDALKEEFNLLKALDPAAQKRKEEITIQAIKTRATNRLAELQDKIARGDFSKAVKPEPVKPDEELLKLRAEIAQAKEKVDEGIFNDQLANRTLGRKIFDNGKSALNLARTIQTGFDFSAVLRQGGFLVLSHPLRAGASLKAMFKAALSKENEAYLWEEIKNRENFQNGNYKAAKLFLADPNAYKLSKMEEAYMGRWQKYIPKALGGGLLRGSNRAYTTFLNHLRADSFDALAKSLSKSGEPTKEELHAIANYVNVATGRGSLGRFEQSAELLNTLFFAPKYVTSRFQLLAGQPLYGGSARTRKLIASEYARYLAGVGVILSLGLAAGGRIETDRRSANFGKLQMGNNFIDPWSGLTQVPTLLTRIGTGQTKKEDGTIQKKSPTEFGVRFIRSKTSPMIGAIWSALEGKDFMGEPTNAATEAAKLAAPLTYGDIKDIMVENGVPEGTAISLLSIFGMTVQVHSKK